MNIDRDDEYATRYEAAPTIEEQIEYCRDVKEKMQRMSIGDPMNDAILASLQKLAAIESQPVPVEPERVKAMRSDTWCGGDVSEALRYIDTLQSALQTCKHNSSVTMDELGEMRDALQRVTEERDDAYEVADSESKGVWSETLLRYAKFNGEHLAVCFERNEYRERAEKAEAELKLAQEELDNQKKRAESLDQELTHCWKQQADAVLALDKAESINRRMLELMKEATDELREYLDGPCALTKSRTDTDCGCVSCTVRKAMRPLINEATK